MHPKGGAHCNPHSPPPAAYTGCRLHWAGYANPPTRSTTTWRWHRLLHHQSSGAPVHNTTPRTPPKDSQLEDDLCTFLATSSSSFGARPPSDTGETTAFFYPTGALVLWLFCAGKPASIRRQCRHVSERVLHMASIQSLVFPFDLITCE